MVAKISILPKNYFFPNKHCYCTTSDILKEPYTHHCQVRQYMAYLFVHLDSLLIFSNYECTTLIIERVENGTESPSRQNESFQWIINQTIILSKSLKKYHLLLSSLTSMKTCTFSSFSSMSILRVKSWLCLFQLLIVRISCTERSFFYKCILEKKLQTVRVISSLLCRLIMPFVARAHAACEVFDLAFAMIFDCFDHRYESILWQVVSSKFQ